MDPRQFCRAVPGYSRFVTVAVLGFFFCLSAKAQEDPFAAGVRTSEPVSPSEQQATFQVPEGFEMQLVASEPDIHKPMNMAFDARGRLWVTTSIEYPYAAPLDRPGRDRLMVFENFDANGRARKVTEFADGLNIPIGVYPYEIPGPDGRPVTRVLVWSIPHIWLMEDLDGDLVADRRIPVYGPFDHTRDTHGNQASFRRGFDGWLYATHGFNNHSRVAGRDGNRVDMQSGNTYRIRLDGSRIEQHTWGQVNPFGASWDPWGNLYTSDCHSAPIYQLIPGGYYPSFGKPHDGLGFAPTLMEHAHGSTAIDGLTYLADDSWGETYRDNIVIGNVMTSRINRDQLQWKGSSPVAIEMPDLMTTSDPWFRPVDTLLGLDGALYIADFYNRIIGHYEVPLDHPGRDRERGRLWRLVPKSTGLRPLALPTTETELIEELGSGSLARRMLAMNTLVDFFGTQAFEAAQVAWDASESESLTEARAYRRAHLLWVLTRLGGLRSADLLSAVHDPQPLVRVHGLRVLEHLAKPTHRPTEFGVGSRSEAEEVFSADFLRRLAMGGVFDQDPRVVRMAVQAASQLPHPVWLQLLIQRLPTLDPEDTHLVYTARKALRDQWLDDSVARFALEHVWDEEAQTRLADVLLAVPRPVAGSFLVRHLPALDRQGLDLRPLLRHAARFAPETETLDMVGFVEERFHNQAAFQLELFQSIQQGYQQRGGSLPQPVLDWGLRLANELLAHADPGRSWRNIPMEGRPTANPWTYETRAFADGSQERVLSSYPRGENLTGTLRTPVFSAPATLEFWLCGHDGTPERPAPGRNRVRLFAVDDGTVLREAAPPRNDVAQKITWNLSQHVGRSVYLDVSDEDTGNAFAWLAIGRIQADGLSMPERSPSETAALWTGACELITQLRPTSGKIPDAVVANLRRLALQPGDSSLRVTAVRAWAAVDSTDRVLRELGWLVLDGGDDPTVREGVAEVLVNRFPGPGGDAVLQSLVEAPARLQIAFARTLARRPHTAERFLQTVESGSVPARVVQDRQVQDLLKAANLLGLTDRLAALAAAGTDLDPSRDALIQRRRQTYQSHAADAERGRAVYAQNCQVCHQLEGQGGLIGPQLTGIGNRGLERLLEDILDPNRNVDHAFRVTLLSLRDGRILSGLVRREEGATLVLANASGDEVVVRDNDIEGREEIDASLMPDNFDELLDEPTLNDLLAYLLAQRETAP